MYIYVCVTSSLPTNLRGGVYQDPYLTYATVAGAERYQFPVSMHSLHHSLLVTLWFGVNFIFYFTSLLSLQQASYAASAAYTAAAARTYAAAAAAAHANPAVAQYAAVVG